MVLRVGGDVGDLGRGEPDVQRVQHRAHGRHGQVRLEVLGVVPHEGADALVGVHAEAAQRIGQAGGPPACLGVRAAPGRVLGAGDDLAIAEDRRSVTHDRRGSARQLNMVRP